MFKAAGMLNEKPENCIVMEDAYAGIDTTKSVNMATLGNGDVAKYEKADFWIQENSQAVQGYDFDRQECFQKIDNNNIPYMSEHIR
jgi:beta-phosphoglucomutase-like phosphatase (HAD superfamily)